MKTKLSRILILAIFVSVFNVFITTAGVSAYTPKFLKDAKDLNDIGLYPITNGDFKLDKQLKRADCAVLILRMAGINMKEPAYNYDSALKSIFTDVPEDATPYVNYLYNNKIMNGVSSTEFGSNQIISLNDFINLLLSFTLSVDKPVNDPLNYLYKDGVLTKKDVEYFKNKKTFLRDDAVGIYCAFLRNRIKYPAKGDGFILDAAIRDYSYKIRTPNKNKKITVVKPNTEGTNQENLFRNTGFITSQDNYAYFVEDGLCRFDLNNNKAERITYIPTYMPNVIGDRIYFLRDYMGAPSMNMFISGYIYSIKLDGTDLKRVSDDLADYLYIKDGWIYYLNQSDVVSKPYLAQSFGKLYRMKLDGSEKTQITSGGVVFNYFIKDSVIYYQDLIKEICKVNIDGSDETYIGGDGIREYNGYVYFSKANGEWPNPDYRIELCRHKVGETAFEVVASSNKKDYSVSQYIVHENRLYFVENYGYGKGAVYSSNLDGSDRKLLFEQYGMINILGGYVYFVNSKENNWFNYYRFKLDGSDKEMITGDKWTKITSK